MMEGDEIVFSMRYLTLAAFSAFLLFGAWSAAAEVKEPSIYCQHDEYGYVDMEAGQECTVGWSPISQDQYQKGLAAEELLDSKKPGPSDKDESVVINWDDFYKLADRGDAWVQFNLGNMYANGWGVPVNNVRAYMWWSLAKAQGDKEAADNLDIVKEQMTPAQIGKAQVLATNWQQASSQQSYQKEEQNVDLEAERKVLNEKLTKIIMEAINWAPLEVTEGTLDNPGPPISQTCPPDVAKRIQEVSEEEFTKLLEKISGDLAIAISNQLSEKLSLSQIRLAIEALENFSGWSDNERKEFQESELGKMVQQIVKPAIVESLKFIGPKFGQLAPKTFQDIEKKLKTEDITKVSEHNWCLQD